MKIAICAVLLNFSFAGAFIAPPQPAGPRMIAVVAKKSSQADLEEKWEDFKEKEKQLEEAEDEVSFTTTKSKACFFFKSRIHL